jgi:hypothetical protein
VKKVEKNQKKSKNQKNLQNPDSESLLCSTRLGRPSFISQLAWGDLDRTSKNFPDFRKI